MISVSLIDYIGEIEGGVGVILNLMIKDNNYEMVYWFNPENKYHIKIEDKFYQDFPNVKNLYEYEYLIDLLHHIHENILPEKSEIFKEFIKNE